MNGSFNFEAYFLNLAIQLKELAHTDQDRHFNRAKGIADLDEFLTNQRTLKGYQLVIVTGESGRFLENNSDNLLNQPYYSFYLLKEAKITDHDAQDLAVKECKVLAAKVFSRMFKERLEASNPLRGLERGSISYNQAGPFAHGWFGVFISFTMKDTTGINYVASDWLDTI
ncbi:MAG: hypothetical protein JXR34_11590 [Bacteroidales bacterium]|nr:hypothetical protein [Bacteroidales bacterium]